MSDTAGSPHSVSSPRCRLGLEMAQPEPVPPYYPPPIALQHRSPREEEAAGEKVVPTGSPYTHARRFMASPPLGRSDLHSDMADPSWRSLLPLSRPRWWPSSTGGLTDECPALGWRARTPYRNLGHVRRYRLLVAWLLLVVLATYACLLGYKGKLFKWYRQLMWTPIDPASHLPPHAQPLASPEGSNASDARPTEWLAACPGPWGFPFPQTPLAAWATPSSHPAAAIGSHAALHLDAGQCATYEARYGAFTDRQVGAMYRYPRSGRGVDAQLETRWGYDELGGLHRPPQNEVDTKRWEQILSQRLYRQNVRAQRLGPHSYPDWAKLLTECDQFVKARMPSPPLASYTANEHGTGARTAAEQGTSTHPRSSAERDAVVLRLYEGFVWREDDILNLRSLIAEVGLACPPASLAEGDAPCIRKDVRLLLEVRDPATVVWLSEDAKTDLLRRTVPIEFWGLVDLWSVPMMRTLYTPAAPPLDDEAFDPGAEARAGGVHTTTLSDRMYSYRNCYQPLQKWALEHGQYEYVWNMEMDVRSTDNYHRMLGSMERYARDQPLDLGLYRAKNWHVVNSSAWEERARGPSPSQASTMAGPQEGRGKEADLISLAPLFDSMWSGWQWESDVKGYPLGTRTPRRGSVGTNVRLSRRLLLAMSRIESEAKKSVHCEGWPATVVLHSHLPINSVASSFYPGPAEEGGGEALLEQTLGMRMGKRACGTGWWCGGERRFGYRYPTPRPLKGVVVPHPMYMRHRWGAAQLERSVNRRWAWRTGHEKALSESSYSYKAQAAADIYGAWKAAPNGSCRAAALLHPVKRVD